MTKTKKFNRSGAFFSLPLFWQGIRKLRIPGIAMAISVIGINALSPIIQATNHPSYSYDYYDVAAEAAPRAIQRVDSFSEFAPFSILLLIFAPLLAFLMFSYLNDRGKSDFYHSIPQTRLCTYFSFTAAIAAWLVAVLTTTTLLNLLLWQLVPYHTVAFGECLALMLCILLGALMVMSMAVLAMTLTGTTVSNLFVALLLFLAARIVFWEVFEAMYDIVPTYDVERSLTRLLLFENYFPVALFSAILSGSRYSTVTLFDGANILYTLLLTLVLLALGALCYHIRRSEMANQSAPNKYMQHIYRCAVTMPLLLWPILDSAVYGFGEDHLWLYALSLLLYVLYEMTTTKKLKNVVRSLPVFGILIAICLALYGSLYGIHALVQADIPAPSQIKTIALSPTDLRLDDDAFSMDDMAIDDPQAIALVVEALDFSAPKTRREYRDLVNQSYNYEYDEYGYTNGNTTVIHKPASYDRIDVQIRLKSGRVLYRSLWIEESKNAQLLDIYYASEIYREAYLSVPTPSEAYSFHINSPGSYYYLTVEQGKRVYDVFYTEYQALSLDQQRIVKDAEYYNGNDYLPRLVVENTRQSRSLFLYVSPDLLPKTFALMAQYEIENDLTYLHGETPVRLTDALQLASSIKITDVIDLKGGQGGSVKYNLCLNLSVCPIQAYAIDNKTSSSSYLWSATFKAYDSKTTEDGENTSFERMQEILHLLQNADNLHDFDNTQKIIFFITLSWEEMPPEISKDLPYFDLRQYITLTPGEAASLVSMMGYTTAWSENIVESPVLE